MDDRLVILDGGLPIVINGDRVGGIGIGGAPVAIWMKPVQLKD